MQVTHRAQGCPQPTRRHGQRPSCVSGVFARLIIFLTLAIMCATGSAGQQGAIGSRDGYPGAPMDRARGNALGRDPSPGDKPMRTSWSRLSCVPGRLVAQPGVLNSHHHHLAIRPLVDWEPDADAVAGRAGAEGGGEERGRAADFADGLLLRRRPGGAQHGLLAFGGGRHGVFLILARGFPGPSSRPMGPSTSDGAASAGGAASRVPACAAGAIGGDSGFNICKWRDEGSFHDCYSADPNGEVITAAQVARCAAPSVAPSALRWGGEAVRSPRHQGSSLASRPGLGIIPMEEGRSIHEQDRKENEADQLRGCQRVDAVPCNTWRSKGRSVAQAGRRSRVYLAARLCGYVDGLAEERSRRRGGRRCGFLVGGKLCANVDPLTPAYMTVDDEINGKWEGCRRCTMSVPSKVTKANVGHSRRGASKEGCRGEEVRMDWERGGRGTVGGGTQGSGHDIRSLTPHCQVTDVVGGRTEGGGDQHQQHRPHVLNTHSIGCIAHLSVTYYVSPPWHGGAADDGTQPLHQPRPPTWGPCLRAAAALCEEWPRENMQPGGGVRCRIPHPWTHPMTLAVGDNWTPANVNRSINDSWNRGRGGAGGRCGMNGRGDSGWADGYGTGGIAPRHRAGALPCMADGAAVDVGGRLALWCVAAGLYAIFVGIPCYAFEDDWEGYLEPMPIRVDQVGGEGPWLERARKGRRRRAAARRGSDQARNRALPRPCVRIVPPCMVIAGRRMPWKSGQRGFRGRRRVNRALRRERWNIVRYRPGRPRDGEADYRAADGPEEGTPPVCCDHAVKDIARQPTDDLPEPRTRTTVGRPTRATRGRSWMMRMIMTMAMCVSTRATGSQLGLSAAMPMARGTQLAALQSAGGDGGASHDVVAWIAKPDLLTAAQYPRPDQTGFHGAFAAGHDNRLGPPTGDQFKLKAVSINSTGWGALKEFLTVTDAHLIFGQEHRLPAHDVPAASAWARRQGWKSVWAPATRGPKGGWSAGTVVLARSFIGLRHPDVGGRIVDEARAVAAVVEAPGFRPFMAYSVYLHHGQGPSRANLGICASIGEHHERQGDPALQFLIAGDWNLEPQILAGTGLTDTMQAKIVHPAGARGTCRTATRSVTYDYFAMSRPMAAVVDGVRSLEATGVRTHTPVELVFLPRPTSLRSLAFRQPPAIPTERVYGPIPAPPPEWGPLLATANGLCDAVRAGAQEKAADQALADLYALWADLAEQELIDINGTTVAKEGMRGQGPRLVWKSILPERRGTGQGGSKAAAWAWLDDLLRDLGRAASRAESREDRLGLVAQLRVAAQADRPRNFAATVPQPLVDNIERLIDDARDLIADDAVVEPTTDDDWRSDPMDDDGDGARRDPHDGQDQRREDQWESDAWHAWRHTFDTLTDNVRRELKRETTSAASERTAKWKEWIREGVDRGARNAHAFSRLPVEWQPSSVKRPDGTVTAQPTAILEGQREKYSAMWSAGDSPGGYEWAERQALPRLTPGDLREASGSFKRRTAVAHDGFHMRHFAQMSDGALCALAAILEACELLGAMPRQCRLVTAPLLEKPRGGYRPICIYASLYRLWAKARQPVAAEWEDRHPRAYLSAAAGNGPADTAWRQAVRQEVTVGQGGHAASLLWDLDGFFERVDRSRLMDRARATGFPLPVLRLSLSMYAAPRVLALDGQIAKELWARDGVGAGCGLATTYVKVYAVPPIDELLPKLPPTTSIDVHVDDFVLSTEAATKEQVVHDLGQAQAALKDVIDKELGARISMPKAAMVASSLGLAKALRESIGELAGPLRCAAPNLGIDASAGKRRGTKAAGVLRKARMASGWKRRKRLRQLADVLGSKARRIYTAGVGPSATYHAAVQGLSDREVLTVRRLAASALPPRSRFRSLTATHIVHNMPTAVTEVAAALQYSRMVWAATICGSGRPRFEGFGLPGLRDAWQKVWDNVHLIIDDAATDDARRRCWSDTRGPLGAAMLELDRVGWRPEGPFEWRDDRGVRVALTETPPALMRDLLVAAVKRKAERVVGLERARRDPAFEGRRACFDVAMHAAARSKTLLPQEKGAFRSVITNAVLTMGRAAAVGYDVSELCPLCGEHRDTIFNRVYRCCKTEGLVRASVPRWFWDESQRAPQDDIFWVTGVMPHPADIIPPPRDDYLPWVINADGERGDDPHLSGHVFIDGSCTVSCVKELQRASFAMVQLDGEARRVKTVSLPLWSTLPQTSQASEHAAYAAVSQLLVGDTVVYGDCQAVINQANAGIRRQLEGRKKYAGVHLAAYRDPASRRRMIGLAKVKAHQHVETIDDRYERWKAIGNNMADEAAKLACDRHPQPTTDQQATIDYYMRRIPLIVRAVGKAMTMFPPAGGNLPRKRRPAAGAKGTSSSRPVGHQWAFVEGRWRCGRCWTYVLGDNVPANRHFQRCEESRVSATMRRSEALGHVMMYAEGELPIVYCSRCGGWSSRRAQHLSRPCAPPTANGKLALRRIAQGLHPWRARDRTTGGDCPRGRLTAITREGPAAQATTEGINGEEVGGGYRYRDQANEYHDLPSLRHDVLDDATTDLARQQGDAADEPDVFGHGGSLEDTREQQDAVGTSRGRPRDDGADDERHHEVDVRAKGGAILDDEGRDPRVRGTSLGMVATVLLEAECARRRGRVMPYGEDSWAIFNQTTGEFVTTTIEAIAAEQRVLIRQFNEEALAEGARMKRRRLDDAAAMHSGEREDGRQEEYEYVCANGLRDQQGESGGDSCRELPPTVSLVGPSGGDGVEPSTSSSTMGPSAFTNREELKRYLQQAGGEPKRRRAAEGGDRRGHKSLAEAGAKGAVNSTVGARVGLGGSHGACATVAVASRLGAGVTATVAASGGAVQLLPENLTASPPSAFAAALDGLGEGAGRQRPELNSLQERPTSLGAGPSEEGREEVLEVGKAPPRGESEEAGGTVVSRSAAAAAPAAAAAVARGGADATARRAGCEKPSRGLFPSTLVARNECSKDDRGDASHGSAEWPSGRQHGRLTDERREGAAEGVGSGGGERACDPGDVALCEASGPRGGGLGTDRSMGPEEGDRRQGLPLHRHEVPGARRGFHRLGQGQRHGGSRGRGEEGDHLPIHGGESGLRGHAGGGRPSAAAQGSGARHPSTAAVAGGDAGGSTGGNDGHERDGHFIGGPKSRQGNSCQPRGEKPYEESPIGGAAETSFTYSGNAGEWPPAERRWREGDDPAIRADLWPDQRSGCTVMSRGDAEAAVADGADRGPRRRISGKRKLEQGCDVAQIVESAQCRHSGAEWPKEATKAGDACGADEFNGPAMSRKRMRGKTGGCHSLRQRQGDQPLQEGEHTVTSLSFQWATRTVPRSSSSREGNMRADSSTRGRGGAAADGESTP